jgi:sporulation protein YlmC with PRC-barrel domain
VIRLSDFDDRIIRTVDGEPLGRVHDVIIEGGQVRSLEYGLRGFIERLRGHGHSNRIAWSDVVDVRNDAIIVNLTKTAS